MKAKIDEEGLLWIERAGKWTDQGCPWCPLDNDGDDVACGDWCPLFVEEGRKGSNTYVEIRCGHSLALHEVMKDERETGDETVHAEG